MTTFRAREGVITGGRSLSYQRLSSHLRPAIVLHQPFGWFGTQEYLQGRIGQAWEAWDHGHFCEAIALLRQSRDSWVTYGKHSLLAACAKRQGDSANPQRPTWLPIIGRSG